MKTNLSKLQCYYKLTNLDSKKEIRCLINVFWLFFFAVTTVTTTIAVNVSPSYGGVFSKFPKIQPCAKNCAKKVGGNVKKVPQRNTYGEDAINAGKTGYQIYDGVKKNESSNNSRKEQRRR